MIARTYNRAWENFKEELKTSAKERVSLYKYKQHQLWFGVECVRSLDQRQQAKMQWLQNPNQSNVNNLNNVKHETSRRLRKRKRITCEISETCRGASVTLA